MAYGEMNLNSTLDRIDRERGKNTILGFEKNVATHWKNSTPKETDFTGIYSPDEIEKDFGYSKRLAKKFSERNTKEGEIKNYQEELNLSRGLREKESGFKTDFSENSGINVVLGDDRYNFDLPDLPIVSSKKEFNPGEATEKARTAEQTIYNLIENGCFDNPKYEVYARPCAKYDDHINHTDLWITFYNPETGKSFDLGVDVTDSQQIDVIERKIKFISDKIKKKQLGEIKYYVSDVDDFKGTRKMPRAILSINRDKIRELAEYMGQNKGRAPKENIVQYEIIQEIEDQLFCYLRFILEQHLSLDLKEEKLLSEIIDAKFLIEFIKKRKKVIEKDPILNKLVEAYLTPFKIMINLKDKKREEFAKNASSLDITPSLRRDHLMPALKRLAA